MLKTKTLLAAALTIGLAGWMTPSLAATLKCSGSTTITNVIFTPEFRKEISEKLGLDVEAVGNSSGAGFKELLAGKVPCSMSTATFEDLLKNAHLEDKSGLKVWVLGSDSVVPIVHRNNAIKTKTLTKDQWGDIYSGKITNWSEVGGPSLPITVVMSADEGSATRQEVQKDIMHGAAYPESARKATTTKDEVAAVGVTAGGAGAVGKGLAMANPAVSSMPALFSRGMILITKGDTPPPGFADLVAYITAPATKAKLGLD
jgi:phosphate transport system substrate-binding protein